MPLYEYYCKPCNSQFELLRPISKMDEAASCPSGLRITHELIQPWRASVVPGCGPGVRTGRCRKAKDARVRRRKRRLDGRRRRRRAG